MAKSYTKRRNKQTSRLSNKHDNSQNHKKEQVQVKHTKEALAKVYLAVDIVAHYIGLWAKKSFNEIAIQSPNIVHSTNNLRQTLPVCWAISDTKYRIGVDTIVKGVNGWYRKMPNGDKSEPFSSLKSAFSYTVLMQQNKYNSAAELKRLDDEYARILSSVDYYMNTAQHSKSPVKRKIAQTRLEESKPKLNYLKNEIKRFHIV